jgi:hypothetical protein
MMTWLSTTPNAMHQFRRKQDFAQGMPESKISLHVGLFPDNTCRAMLQTLKGTGRLWLAAAERETITNSVGAQALLGFSARYSTAVKSVNG